MYSATRLVLLGGIAAALGACGGGGGGGGNNSTCTPANSSTITITSGGTSPKNACVLPNGSVTFANDDSVEHQIESTDACPGFDTGSIAANGNSTVSFPTVGQCPYHEASDPANTKFQGLVAVTQTTVGGGGY
jgi:hypothetical protein